MLIETLVETKADPHGNIKVYYVLGDDGLCSNPEWATCIYRLACRKCPFSLRKSKHSKSVRVMGSNAFSFPCLCSEHSFSLPSAWRRIFAVHSLTTGLSPTPSGCSCCEDQNRSREGGEPKGRHLIRQGPSSLCTKAQNCRALVQSRRQCGRFPFLLRVKSTRPA